MSAYAIALGYAADRALGDPRRWHPVAGFGRAAAALESRMWRSSRSTGALYCVALVAAVTLPLRWIDRRLYGTARHALGAATVFSALGGRSLAREATALADAVARGDIDRARAIAPALVGRDPSVLDDAGLVRAAIESVAENTSDAVVGTLMWTALFGPAGAAAYRAVDTLDSMVGHRSERYAEFGWGAARLDDALNWPAASLTVVLTAACAPLVGGSASDALRAAPGARRHPSPNAGRVEGAFAGALSVTLGGTTVYPYGVDDRPLLGTGAPPAVADVERAVSLARAVGACAAMACTLFAWRRP